ncbi:MAG: hypothetical protein CL569_13985 [Alphaproteobacteria bacterium]|nr:hypothetical protein [Alphaproteobacteria bacterium]
MDVSGWLGLRSNVVNYNRWIALWKRLTYFSGSQGQSVWLADKIHSQIGQAPALAPSLLTVGINWQERFEAR